MKCPFQTTLYDLQKSNNNIVIKIAIFFYLVPPKKESENQYLWDKNLDQYSRHSQEKLTICPLVIFKPLTTIPLAKLSPSFHCWLCVTSCIHDAPLLPIFHVTHWSSSPQAEEIPLPPNQVGRLSSKPFALEPFNILSQSSCFEMSWSRRPMSVRVALMHHRHDFHSQDWLLTFSWFPHWRLYLNFSP